MNFYFPFWSKTCDSSLWVEPDFVIKVFITMMAKQDLDHVVRGTAFNIAQWAKKTELEVLEALKILSSPDTKRIEPQPFEGRRIERVEEGWLILNAEKYQKWMQETNRKSRQAKWMAAHRAKIAAMTPEERAAYEAGREAVRKARKVGKKAWEIQGRRDQVVESVRDGNAEAKAQGHTGKD